ncbi:GDSL-type esterase/lipase family protein [Clostridium aminobutyricum]|uniref:SGNH hydrolase-type esterase domain-containing protein n=1 Tax=Clostridium aminobutyricum TaxID=33953 RepID=A0A939IKE9_CLOAM|nr:GDSL-type esterase/lipase family protein [Clostridium aminobutyricum]MBN7774539.1 hypothetical protein [Clostridium aminobutyricum]
MDKIKNRRSFQLAIIAGAILVVTGMLFLLHMGKNPSSEAIPPKSGQSNEVDSEDKNQANQQGGGEENQNSSSEVIATEPSKPKPVDDNPADSGEEKGGVPIEKPAPTDADNPFAVFNNTLFIGDSRTEGFRLYSGVNNASYFCLKAMTVDDIVDGKTIRMSGQDVSVYDLLENGAYDKVIISVGLNELGWNHIETFLQEYGQLIDNIKQRQPNATVYVQAVLPVSRGKDASDKVHNNAQIYWYDTNIVQLAESKGAIYFNPAPAVVDADGFLLDEATTDGIHLNSEYCKKLAAYMADMI